MTPLADPIRRPRFRPPKPQTLEESAPVGETAQKEETDLLADSIRRPRGCSPGRRTLQDAVHVDLHVASPSIR